MIQPYDASVGSGPSAGGGGYWVPKPGGGYEWKKEQGGGGGFPWSSAGKAIPAAAGLANTFMGGGNGLAPGESAGNYIWGLGPSNAYPWGGGTRNLLDLLNNPGQTDPTMFNRSLTANSRSTQARSDAARGRFARSGFGNSGVALAMQSAIQGAGMDKEADLRANEARRREDLRRSDLGFLKSFVQDPLLAKYANDRGIAASMSGIDAQKKGAQYSSLASLLGALAQIDWGGDS